MIWPAHFHAAMEYLISMSPYTVHTTVQLSYYVQLDTGLDHRCEASNEIHTLTSGDFPMPLEEKAAEYLQIVFCCRKALRSLTITREAHSSAIYIMSIFNTFRRPLSRIAEAKYICRTFSTNGSSRPVDYPYPSTSMPIKSNSNVQGADTRRP